MNYEEQVKDKLFKLWEKEAIRIEKINGGWERRKVSLGKCMIKDLSVATVHDMISVIEDFGIPMKKLNINYDQIVDTYHAINAYRLSVRFLKNLKTKIDLFKRYN